MDDNKKKPRQDGPGFARRRVSLRDPALYLALLYLLLALLWIFGTDWLLSLLPHDYRSLEVSKGVLFVLVTAWLLHAALRRNAELKLAAVRRHYDHLTRYANDIFLLADENYRIVEANERAVDAYGYSREELVGMSVRQLRAEAYRGRLEEDFSKLAENGTLYEIEQCRKDGTTFPVEVSARLIEIEGRRFFQGIIRDISERKQAEAALAQSRLRFMALLDSIPDPAWMKDAGGRILAANKAFARATGLPVRDMIGKSDADFWPSGVAARFRDVDEKVLHRRQPVRLDELLPTSAGERWFETVNTPVFDDAGAVIGTTGIARDVTERREAERRIVESRQHLRALLDGIPDVAWMKDRAGCYTAFNKAFAERAGRSKEEIIGRTAPEVWPEPYRRCFYEDDAEVLDSARTVQRESSVEQGGEVCWSLVTRAPILDDEGKVTGVAGIARDITERKNSEIRLRFMNTLLATQQEVSPDGILLVDDRTRILNYNRHFVDLFGVPDELVEAGEDEPVLRWCLERMADPEAAVQRIRFLYGQREARARDELHLRDGRIVERDTAPVVGADGTYYGRVWFFRDVTGERRVRQALQESESRFRGLVELSPDGIVLIGGDGIILGANPAALSMFGVASLDEVVGQSQYRFVPEDQRTVFDGHLADLLRLGSTHSLDSEYLRTDGTRFFAEVSAAVIPRGAGEPSLLTAIVRDITERRQREAQLTALNRALKVLSECNGDLVRATEEAGLLETICRTLTTTGGYRMAAVAYEQSGVMVRQQIACAPGDELSDVAWADAVRERHPDAVVWRAMDQGIAVRADEADLDRHSGLTFSLREMGVAAVLILPLKEEDKHSFGILALVSGQSGAFSAEEVRLLDELAGDLAFGIRMIRIRRAHDEAMRQINVSEAKLRTVVEHTSDGIVMIDAAGTIQFANAGAERLLARPIASLVGSTLDVPLEGNLPVERTVHDGSTAVVELTTADTEWEGKPARIVALHDVTVRRQIERERQQHMQQLKDRLIQTIEAMALTVEKRDPYTAGHQGRVAELAVTIGCELGLPETRLDGLRLGALIHDIGKIYIPAEILNRPGRLSEPEMSIIRTHPTVGYEIVRNIDFPWPVKEMVGQHHERIDGSGYPEGLKGGQIAFEARILAVADVVEAMASHRPYRPSLGTERGIEEIRRGRGTLYDAEVVDACLRLFEEKHFTFDFGE